MPLNTETYDRRDHLEDKLGDIVERTDEYDFFAELLAREDERIWAWYRDPETDLTQIEARDRAQNQDYGDRYNLTQSSVSRKIQQLDEEMLTNPVAELNTDKPLFQYDPYRELEKQYPAYTEACRRWLAKTICDFLAVRELEPPTFDVDEKPADDLPAEWAMDRLSYVPDELIGDWQNGKYSP